MSRILALLEQKKPAQLGLLLLMSLLFLKAIGFEVTLDSRRFLLEDPRIRDRDLFAIFTTDYWNHAADAAMAEAESDLYRPLTLTFLSLLGGGSAETSPDAVFRGVNIGNILLHVGATLLRFELFLILLRRHARGKLLAFLAAALCAVHPVATEAVGTQVGASEGLAAVFGTASLLLLVRRESGPSRRARGLSAVCFLLALLSKENAVALVVVIPPLLCVALSWPFKKSLRIGLDAVGVVAVWLLLRALIFGSLGGVADPVFAGFSFAARLATALGILVTYDLPALLFPFRLLPLVSHQDVRLTSNFAEPVVVGGALLVLSVLAAILWLRRRAPEAALGLWCFAALFAPVSNLVLPIGALAATRFLYFPWTGAALAVSLALAPLLGSRGGAKQKLGAVLASLLIVGFSVATWRELGLWRSEALLYETTRERSPAAFAALNLGEIRRREAEAIRPKDPARAAKLEAESISHFESGAMSAWPRIPGTDRVPEDVLDAAFKPAMNAVLMHQIRLERVSGPNEVGLVVKDLERTLARAREIAVQGQRQETSGDGTTRWAPLHSDVFVVEAGIELSLAQKSGEAAKRSEHWARAEKALLAARAERAQNFKIDRVMLQLLDAKGDRAGVQAHLQDAFQRARPLIGTDSRAAEIAQLQVELLKRRGDATGALLLTLQILVEGRLMVDGAQPFLTFGEQGIRSGRPDLVALGEEAIREFLKRTKKDSDAYRRALMLLRARGSG